MFGALRCNKDARNNLEYVDLSGDNSVDPLKHIGPVSEPPLTAAILIRKQGGVAEATDPRLMTNVEHRRSADASNSKRRRPASESTSSPKPSVKPAKRQQTRRNADSSPPARNAASIQGDLSQPMSSIDLKDGFWTSGLALTELLQDPNDSPPPEPHNQERTLGENVDAIQSVFPVPETPSTPSYLAATTALSILNDDHVHDFIMTPPPTADPSGRTPLASSSEPPSRGCGCIGSLADTLQQLGGDNGGGGSEPTDGDDRFDTLLGHLRDGIETCKQVLPCARCCVPATNSIFVVTVVQQLATVAQDLCRQLLSYQRKAALHNDDENHNHHHHHHHNNKDNNNNNDDMHNHYHSTMTSTSPPLLLTANISIGRYQVQPTALRLGFLFPIVRLYLNDLHLFLEQLRARIKQGTKACRMLGAVTEMVQTALKDWQMALKGQQTERRARATL